MLSKNTKRASRRAAAWRIARRRRKLLFDLHPQPHPDDVKPLWWYRERRHFSCNCCANRTKGRPRQGRGDGAFNRARIYRLRQQRREIKHWVLTTYDLDDDRVTVRCDPRTILESWG